MLKVSRQAGRYGIRLDADGHPDPQGAAVRVGGAVMVAKSRVLDAF